MSSQANTYERCKNCGHVAHPRESDEWTVGAPCSKCKQDPYRHEHADAINPKHYQGVFISALDVGTFEVQCIDVIEVLDLGFHLGNALKYAWRFGRKHNRLDEEIGKCLWYLDRWRDQGYEREELRKAASWDSSSTPALRLSSHLRTMCTTWSKRPGWTTDWGPSTKWMEELIELLGIEMPLAAHVRKQNAG